MLKAKVELIDYRQNLAEIRERLNSIERAEKRAEEELMRFVRPASGHRSSRRKRWARPA